MTQFVSDAFVFYLAATAHFRPLRDDKLLFSGGFTIMRSISNTHSGEPSGLFVRPRACAAQ
jgi:hypothetical protein